MKIITFAGALLAAAAVLAQAIGAAADTGGTGVSARDLGPTTQPRSKPAALKVTLAEAATLALKNSRALKVAAQAVEGALAGVDEARASAKPSVGAIGTLARMDKELSATLPGAGDIALNRENQGSVALQAMLPIDITGLIRTAVKASDLQVAMARLGVEQTRLGVVLGVRTAYYDVLRARAFAEVAEAALKNARERATMADAYEKAGTGTKFDVLRAETEVANVAQSALMASNGVKLATAALNHALGIDQNTPTEIADAPDAAAAPELPAALELAYARRPEVAQAEAGVRAAELGIRLAQRSSLPTLGVSWTGRYTPDDAGLAPQKTSWMAAAQANLPLFDQGMAKARVRKARADVEAAANGKQVLLDGIALQVRQAHLDLANATERLTVTAAALQQAEEQYRLSQVRFETGVTQAPGASPLLEASDAQTALTQARINHLTARYDILSARARLDAAMGAM
ncbi:MAG: TolC family protein [Armatimonadetes bacterium]|nr:TolC family protein [Armatimonadota bacterium]